MSLCSDFLSVFESEPHIILAVDCSIIHQSVPEGGIKPVHQVGFFEAARKASIVALRDCLLWIASSTASNRALAVSNRAVRPS